MVSNNMKGDSSGLDYNNTTRASQRSVHRDVLESYGVYGNHQRRRRSDEDDDDDGFMPSTAGRFHSVVNYNGANQTSTNVLRNNVVDVGVVEAAAEGGGWCAKAAGCCGPEDGRCATGVTSTGGRANGWQRPAIFLLLVVLVVVVFVFIASIMLYFNYMTYRPRLQLLDEPCEKKYCPWGAVCVLGADDAARCECPAECPAEPGAAAVCGTDDVTYETQCLLRRKACLEQDSTRVRHSGACDPCAAVSCAEGEVCQLDGDRSASCRCGDACSLELTPVCASDGKTYPNECSLRTEACRARSQLRIIYRGKCGSGVNPCASIDCAPGEHCAINRFGIARCECPAPCQPMLRPVCADDGRTYESECELRRAACGAKKHIGVKHAGACGAASVCSAHACTFGAVCAERAGVATCECALCPLEFAPVCGSDGITYNNECQLKQEGCQHKRKIDKLYDGLCNGCENRKCEHYAVCESDGGGNSECVCPSPCVSFDSPVCGSDGKTYKNDCDLRYTSCKTQQAVQTAYKGDCDLCVGVVCSQGARCEAGECVCPTDCADDAATAEPLCASNMATYRGECELRKAKCLDAGTAPLTVLFYGECREKLQLTTQTVPSQQQTLPPPPLPPPHKPVESNIILTGGGGGGGAEEREACRDIRCDFEATCELAGDGLPRCSCHFDCTQPETAIVNKAVCASDLKLYASLCAMKMEGCMRQAELRLRPLELCRGMEVKPCNGDTPLVDEAGREMDCGHGPSRKDCPSGSYCHQTTHFAKCCKKEGPGSAATCETSWFGCCPDGKTSAQGADNAGCPIQCGCHRLGAVADAPCHPETRQCVCKPGVGGERCDRCEPGFWGLPKISEGHQGCIPCGCSVWGAVRDDCEQMTGRCVCKPGVQGQKCTGCTGHGRQLGPHGCVKGEVSTPAAASCSLLDCYFNAICEEHHGHAECVCRSACSDEPISTQVVCGNDGQTYGSECQLKLFSCRYQKDIVVQALGACKEEMFPGTEWPLRRSTADRFTEPGDVSSTLYKSTRHLLMPSNKYTGYNSRLTLEPRHQSAKSSGYHDSMGGYRPTAATIGVVHALLGDLCTEHAHCGVTNSRCVALACACAEGHAETPDRQQCIANTAPLRPSLHVHACASAPCLNGATCADELRGEFVCACAEAFTGSRCETPVRKAYSVPAFDGRSYVRLKHLKAYNKLSVELEFKTYANDGILLYNQQKADGTGDFVSLALVNGFVEFRYNLGNGAVVIRSLDRVQLKKFHRVVAKRYHRDGMLKLDDSEDVAGQSQGSLKSLDLSEHAYVGYVPTNVSKVFENAGTSSGLSGCVRRLRIGRHLVSLHPGADALVESAHGVAECGENPCGRVPCLNGGACRALDAETYRCACAAHATGTHCEILVDLCDPSPCFEGSTCEAQPQGGYACRCPPGRKGSLCQQHLGDAHESHDIPDFAGTTYLQLPRLEGVGRGFTLELWFLTRAADGLLLYNGQLTTGRGDFIAVAVRLGRLQFRFDLGSGPANLTTSEEVTPGRWHVARVTRVDKDATLRLDDGVVVVGASGPPLNELNLELPLYIGGLPPSEAASSREPGLDGVVQRLMVNGRPLLGLHRRAAWPPGLRPYDAHPACQPRPCRNDGICRPALEAFTCSCSPLQTGALCESELEGDAASVAVRFTGDTFYQYPSKVGGSLNETWISANTTLAGLEEGPEEEGDDYEEGRADEDGEGDMYDEDDVDFFDAGRQGERANRFELSFQTSESDGLLLWTNKGHTLRHDFLAVAVVDDFVEFSFNLGKQASLLAARSKVVVSDGAWHTVLAQRRRRGGSLSVDGEPPVRVLAARGATLLDTDKRLFIGGAAVLPSGLPAAYYLGFRGCVDKVRVDRAPLDLLRSRLGQDKTAPALLCHDNEV